MERGAESNRHRSSLPDAAMFLADQLVVVDHANHDIYVLALYHEGVTGETSDSTLVDNLSPSNEKIVTVCGLEDKKKRISTLTTGLDTNDVQSKSLDVGNIGR